MNKGYIYLNDLDGDLSSLKKLKPGGKITLSKDFSEEYGHNLILPELEMILKLLHSKEDEDLYICIRTI